MSEDNSSFLKKLKQIFIGRARNIRDKELFKHTSLIAFLAWVGLGGDCLTSSCYGPPEAFMALGHHTYLGVIVALMTTFTIFMIAAGYNLIIELFPLGGGGYFVAGRLLSPKVGMISGCALVLDYVLTITISIASGTDAIFSLLPKDFAGFKLGFSLAVVLFFIVLNLRGVKESVRVLLPVFLLFLITHLIAITYSFTSRLSDIDNVATKVAGNIQSAHSQLGTYGLLFLILKAFSMGAGTFTGIEAVSNGMPILREPKTVTAKRTMVYMASTLAIMVIGLMVSYLLYNIKAVPNKTLNAVLFETMTKDWTRFGSAFVIIILVSEASLLFVAAQTGFLDGPRVLGNMASDKWFPTSFAMLSDRLVTQKGIMLMGIMSGSMMIISHQSVKFLIVLFSINVFITFTLSQLGMSKHWLNERKNEEKWLKKFLINGSSFLVCGFILIMVATLKFHEGGWITMLTTGVFISFALFVKKHYNRTEKKLKKLDTLIQNPDQNMKETLQNIKDKLGKEISKSESDKTAVLLVSGYNGSGISSLFNALKLFDARFKTIVFVEVEILNTNTFKNEALIHQLDEEIKSDLKHYVGLVNKFGFEGKAIRTMGTDVSEEALKIAPSIIDKYPDSIFFGGQLVFPKDTIFTRYLHNYAAFSLQKNFYEKGIPFIVLPIDIT